MRIVYVCNEYPPAGNAAGIGIFVQTMARAMATRGHDVTVVGVGTQDHDVCTSGVRVVTLGASSVRGLRFVHRRWRLYRWLSRASAGGRIDIVEVPDFEGMLPFSIRALPVVVRLHLTSTVLTPVIPAPPTVFGRWAERRTLAQHTHWIATSRFVLSETQRVFGLCPRESAVIDNPATIEDSTPSAAPLLPTWFVLFAGTVTVRKGLVDLARAARLFLARHEDLHLVLAGRIMEPDLVGRIQDIVGAALAPRVHFLGKLSHSATLSCMRKARALLLLSTIEGSALVVLEAMSCGAVVVCSRRGPGPEILEDGVSGLLVDSTDPDDVSAKVSSLLTDSDLAERLAERARRTASERFSIDRCASATEAFYMRRLKPQIP